MTNRVRWRDPLFQLPNRFFETQRLWMLKEWRMEKFGSRRPVWKSIAAFRFNMAFSSSASVTYSSRGIRSQWALPLYSISKGQSNWREDVLCSWRLWLLRASHTSPSCSGDWENSTSFPLIFGNRGKGKTDWWIVSFSPALLSTSISETVTMSASPQ